MFSAVGYDSTMDTVICDQCSKTVERRKYGPHKSAHARRTRARYVYDDSKDPLHKHPLHRASCKGCAKEALMRVDGRGFCSKSCSQNGENNSRWTGDQGGYVTLHQRIYVTLGKASERRCICGERARDWANLTGDYADTYDYAAMCRRCHQRYDKARQSMEGEK